MVIFNRQSIDFLETNLSPPSLLGRLPQKLRRKLESTSRKQQANLPFATSDDQVEDDVLNFQGNKASLEQRARAFFKLAKVDDRQESRYNSHGNRGSFHGQKNKIYKNVFSGTEVIDSMVASGLAASREAALSIGNKLSTDLNLFSRANPPSSNGNKSSGHQGKSRGKARANLLAAQTILLGSTSDNLESDTAGRRANADASSPGCFVDDSNAFYRFGPGVLAILRGIDADDDDDKFDKPQPTIETLAPIIAEESKNGLKKNHELKPVTDTKTKIPEKNLSLVPNAPGGNGNVVLEDLFLLRHPEMKMIPKEAGNTTTDDAFTKVNQGGSNKKSSKNSGKKKAKKTSAASVPSAFPKSILKNDNCNNRSKMKKKKTPKTKGNQKKPAHKFKAGEKIKYVSDKERKIASIEKRLSAFHSDHVIALHRQMLKELENRLSRLYTGDHFEIISLSSHSTYPASPKKHQENFVSAFDNVPTEEKTLVTDCSTDTIGASNNPHHDIARKNVPNQTFESLDDIISNNADLLANADDSASVWTEFIMGTSRNDYKEPCNGEEAPSYNLEEKTKVEAPKVKLDSKGIDNRFCTLPKVAEAEELEMESNLIEQLHYQQHEQQKEVQRTTGWQAPTPLECGDWNKKIENGKNTRRGGNEIDLASWETASRNREMKENKSNEWTKNSFVLCQAATLCESQTSNVSLKNRNDFASIHDGAPDDLSLFLEQQQEREFQSLTIFGGSVGSGLMNQGLEDSGSNLTGISKETNTIPIIEKLGTGISSIDTIISDTTKDSNDLTKLRIEPLHQKKAKQTNATNNSGNERIEEGEGENRSYRFAAIGGTKTSDSELDYLSTPTPTSNDDDRSDASDESDSGIMEAIENDTFYQQAVRESDTSHTVATVENHSNDDFNVFAASPGQSEPGSFTASFNERYSSDEFDGEVATIDTYSDEGSYMELTVEDNEVPCEEFEEEIIEEDLYDEVTVVSEESKPQASPSTMGSRPTLSPKRKSAQFRSTSYLPSVPELGPEPEPEPEPQPTSPKRENSVYVEVHSMADDDEMTQITMDWFLSAGFQSNRSLHIIPEDEYSINNGDYSNHNSYLLPLREGNEVKSGGNALVSPVRNRNSRATKKITPPTRPKNRFFAQQQLKKRTKYAASSTPMGRPCKTILQTETSQQRIQEILWKDLPSSDVTITWSALEELRILVAHESRSRAYLVRHGGVMVIIDTMAEQIEVEVIQFLCCYILEQLASVDFEIGLTILELGGVSLIEESMRKHSNSDRVKKTGDTALRTLLRTS